jgi:SET domain-containing protein
MMTYEEMIKAEGWETLEKALRPFWETLDDVRPMPGHYVVRPSPIHGFGLFASQDLDAGEVIGPARINGIRSELGRYCNHSSDPNGKAVRDNNEDLYFVARRPILKDVEICVDYRQVFAVNKELHVCR